MSRINQRNWVSMHKKELTKLFSASLLCAFIIWSIFSHFQLITHRHIQNETSHNHSLTELKENKKTQYKFSRIFIDEESAELLHSHNKATHTHGEDIYKIGVEEAKTNQESEYELSSDSLLGNEESTALISLARGDYGLRPVGDLSFHAHVLQDINSDGQYFHLNKKIQINQTLPAPIYFVSVYKKELSLPWCARAPPFFSISYQT